MSLVIEKGPAARVGESRKDLGAFYTDVQIADFLVWWAVRSETDRVIDPGFGGGVFLRSACRRIDALGGNPADQVAGVELDEGAYARVSKELGDRFAVKSGNLVHADFFTIGPETFGLFDAVVGNPPFVRYQRFFGASRERALRCAARSGVHLSRLTSSWAPFLVHGIAMLGEGGRLAMVLPMEIGHAAYARPVLELLSKSFKTVTFLTFQQKLFPSLSEDTLLLLADSKGLANSDFLWRDLADVRALVRIEQAGRTSLKRTRRLDAASVSQGQERLAEQFIPGKARELYRRLKGGLASQRLGDVAEVGIGYVTGANSFFHLTQKDADHWGIPADVLRPAVFRGRSLTGLRMTRADWLSAQKAGDAGYLLLLEPPEADLPQNVRRYLEHGKTLGVPEAYKCRTRSPWFRVPHVHEADALLSYMSGATPHLVSNEAELVAPNSLHVVRLKVNALRMQRTLTALWLTSLTRLSVEIEGHAMGGGMLKLEPTEAENVLLPSSEEDDRRFQEFAHDLDRLVRQGREEQAQRSADRMFLIRGLGLSRRDCTALRTAAEKLRNRRYVRGQSHEPG